VLPVRVITGGSLVIEGATIVAVEASAPAVPSGASIVDARGLFVVPGFIDVHVHGVEGHDTLDDGNPVWHIAATLPRYGVTAFCPTTVACAPGPLRGFLEQVRSARGGVRQGARVLPAHLESNFINPEFCGAQPVACLRLPVAADAATPREGDFSGQDILAVIEASRIDVGIVTLAPEITGGIELVGRLVAQGHRVSLGHSAADFETANAAIDAGARHATHLFNRMSPLAHRAPGLVGAVLSRDEVVAELICDGYHVHPAIGRLAIAAKGIAGVMAITDGTAGSGLPLGAAARLGGRPIHVRDRAAFLDDGTLAGSTLTMDAAFRTIVHRFGIPIHEAAAMCSTTPARTLGLAGFGHIAEGACADLVMLNRDLRVVRTYVDGREIYRSPSA
jgi:N-acetylglucosamine-6-phosphate deacetylase